MEDIERKLVEALAGGAIMVVSSQDNPPRVIIQFTNLERAQNLHSFLSKVVADA